MIATVEEFRAHVAAWQQAERDLAEHERHCTGHSGECRAWIVETAGRGAGEALEARGWLLQAAHNLERLAVATANGA